MAYETKAVALAGQAPLPPVTEEPKSKFEPKANWTAAFLLFAKGVSLKEISHELGLKYQSVRTKAERDEWERLVRLNQSLAVKAPSKAVERLSARTMKDVEKRIEVNREEALSISQRLRGHIKKILDAYEASDIYLSVNDILSLAKAASQIDQSAMLALGDDPAPKISPTQALAPAVNTGPTTHFHIHPPAQAMAPRVPRQVVEEAVVGQPVQRDAIMGFAVESNCGRATVDFKKLGADIAAVLPPKPTNGVIPEFARAG